MAFETGNPVPAAAVHRTVLVVDVEGFSRRSRTTPHQVAVRDGLYRALRGALERTGVVWSECHHEDRGDGVVVLLPASVAKAPLVARLPLLLVDAIREHNRGRVAPERFRLRLALHAGEVAFDRHGVTSAAVTSTFRLVDAPALREALAASPGVLALITSDWFFEEVVRHSPDARPATFRPTRVSVKETSAVGWLALPDHPYPPDTAPPDTAPPDTGRRTGVPVPHQLPGDPRWFTGRTRELDLLTAEVDRAAADPAPVTTVVHGTGGIGKTWLVLRWCHRHLDRFPDGRLFVDLRGFSPTGDELTAVGVLRCFLDALGVPPQSIPVAFEAQQGLYRTLVAGRRMVIVLDNVRDTDQVAPVLPGTPTCVVLVTSRNRLDGLVTGHGATLVPLDVLADPEDRALLTARLGGPRLAAEPAATAELLARCGGFPLALSIVGARAAAHPGFPLADLAGELRDTTTRLGVLDDDEPVSSLPAVLSWSCRALTDEQVTAFRLIAVAPGEDVGVATAAALLGVPVGRAAAALRALERISLVQQHVPRRWRMHDLVRLYAADQERRSVRAEAALRRVVDFFRHTARHADRVLFPSGPSYPVEPPGPDWHPVRPADRSAAMAWFGAEHECLIAAQQAAVDREWHPAVWQLAWSMHTFHWWQGHFRDHVAVWRAGLAAADRVAGRSVRATANLMYGDALTKVGRVAEALDHLDRGLALAVGAGDVAGQARAHFVLVWTWEHLDRRRALEHARRSLAQFRTAGEPVWTALALNAVGWFETLLDDHAAARAHCVQALELFREHHDRNGEATALHSLGCIAQRTGLLADAAAHYATALRLYQELDNAYCEASTLERLAETHLAGGDVELAAVTWHRAHDLYRTQHRTADHDRLSAVLRALASGRDPAAVPAGAPGRPGEIVF